MAAKTRGKNKEEEELEGSKALAEAGDKGTDESKPPTETKAKIKKDEAKDETDESKLPPKIDESRLLTDAEAKIKKAKAKDETDESKPEAKIKKINPKMAAGTTQKNKKKSEIAAAKSQSKTFNPSGEEEKYDRDAEWAAFLAASKSKAADGKSVDIPTISNKVGAPGVVSQTTQHEEEVKATGEAEDKEEEVEEDPILEQCTTFTLDEMDSLNYHQLENNQQPPGSSGRFSGKDLTKHTVNNK